MSIFKRLFGEKKEHTVRWKSDVEPSCDVVNKSLQENGKTITNELDMELTSYLIKGSDDPQHHQLVIGKHYNDPQLSDVIVGGSLSGLDKDIAELKDYKERLESAPWGYLDAVDLKEVARGEVIFQALIEEAAADERKQAIYNEVRKDKK